MNEEYSFFDMNLTLPRKRRVSRHGTLKNVVQSESISHGTPAGIDLPVLENNELEVAVEYKVRK